MDDPKTTRVGNARSGRFPLTMRHAIALTDTWFSRHLGTPPRRLPVLLAFLTDRCNLQCAMCGVYRHPKASSDGELTTDEWASVLDSAAQLGALIVSFTGGEPLLRGDLYDLIAHARNRNLAVHLCTNGTALSEKVAKDLDRAGVNSVSISLEGPSQETHDLLRGPGNFARTVEGIERLGLAAPRVKLGINYLITAVNFRGLADMIPFAERLGVDQIKFAPIHTNLLHRDKPLHTYSGLLFGEEDLPALEEEVQRLIRAMRGTRLQTTSTAFLKGITSLYRKPRSFLCYAGYAACAVNPRGFVSPCCDHPSAVNVKNRPLHEIWASREFHRQRRRAAACGSCCWDTTNTELSLRLSVRSLLRDVPETLRDLRFYLGGRK